VAPADPSGASPFRAKPDPRGFWGGTLSMDFDGLPNDLKLRQRAAELRKKGKEDLTWEVEALGQ
jgi:hypothetical protein